MGPLKKTTCPHQLLLTLYYQFSHINKKSSEFQFLIEKQAFPFNWQISSTMKILFNPHKPRNKLQLHLYTHNTALKLKNIIIFILCYSVCVGEKDLIKNCYDFESSSQLFSLTVSFLSFSKYSFWDSAKTAAKIFSSSHEEKPTIKKQNTKSKWRNDHL